MSFVPVDVIRKKREGESLSKTDIENFIQGFTKEEIPDYQVSAWLMATYLKGMTSEEASFLTESMLHSGTVLDFSNFPEKKVDKHSTGGVGDKTSMVIAPLVAAAGVRVPMIAGRGLGHTGGTLDKLESIKGFNTRLSLDDFKKLIDEIGVAIIGQTAEICPADRKLYSLRDVTATVESIPLICASIMSKKLAEGIDGLVLDVKFGSGAFMKEYSQAKELAQSLKAIGEHHGKKVAALLTSMEQPLGAYAGNSLEIKECLSILKNEPFSDHDMKDFQDTKELSVELSGYMIWLGGEASSAEEGIAKANELLESGRAYEKFEIMCKAQGGDLNQIPEHEFEKTITATESGFVKSMNTREIGMAGILLGAGRIKAEDEIDFTAGIRFHKKIGEEIKSGEPLMTLYRSEKDDFSAAEARLAGTVEYSSDKIELPELVRERLI